MFARPRHVHVGALGRSRPSATGPRPRRQPATPGPLAGAVVLALLMVSGAAGTPTAQAGAPVSDWELCFNQTSVQEQTSGIPDDILTAISLVESGRWDEHRQARVAWPWTVNNGSVGKFFPSKAAAIAHVRDLKAQGETNIDVGCMQINLRYHGDAFPTLDKAFEPKSNVAYAVDFLTRLQAETGSWTRAVTRYHSATPVYAERYLKKFRVAWRDAQEQAAERGLPAERNILAKAQERAAEKAAERARQEAIRQAELAEARTVAQQWRAEKLAAWQARRQARLETGDTRAAPNG